VEEPKKATKPKLMSRDEKERQKRLQDQEKRRMKEVDLLRAQGDTSLVNACKDHWLLL
jgi:hypothetical protein